MRLEELKNFDAPISSTSIICGVKCPRKFFYRYRWGLVPKRPKYSAGKISGSLVHRLLQLGPDEVEKVRTEVATRQKELMELVAKGEDTFGELAREAQNLTDLFNKALAMVTIFWECYPQPEHLETIGKELRIELKGLPAFKQKEGYDTAQATTNLIAKGFLDSLVRNKKTGEIWIRDTKTTGRPLGLVTLGYAWSIPCRYYRYITHHWLKQNGYDETKLRGIILDIMQTPTIKFCKKDKTFADYIIRVKEWYKEKGDGAMLSKGIMYTEPLLSDELFASLSNTVSLLERGLEPENFSKDITCISCKEYDRECSYYDLCSSDYRLWESIVEKQFTVLEKKEEKNENEKECD